MYMEKLKMITHSVSGLLYPVEPLDFAKSLDFIEDFNSTREDQIIFDGILTKSFSGFGKYRCYPDQIVRNDRFSHP
jgi:hypothetical protein